MEPTIGKVFSKSKVYSPSSDCKSDGVRFNEEFIKTIKVKK